MPYAMVAAMCRGCRCLGSKALPLQIQGKKVKSKPVSHFEVNFEIISELEEKRENERRPARDLTASIQTRSDTISQAIEPSKEYDPFASRLKKEQALLDMRMWQPDESLRR